MENIKFKNTDAREFVLNEFTKGYAQCIDNNWNFAAYAQDPSVSVYQNDYNAGYVQGKVTGGDMIKATRNNTWRWYVLDEGPGADSTEIPPNGLEIVTKHLVDNYNWMIDYVEKNQASDIKVRNIMRLMYRMLGIFHGAADKEPLKDVKFDDLKLSNMDPFESATRAGDDPLSFMDIYFINAQMDIWDAAGKELGVALNALQKDVEEHKLDNSEMEMDKF